MNYILTDESFPLNCDADTSIEFLKKSNEFNIDDMQAFDEWFEKRQEWYFRHSWYVNRAGSFLPGVMSMLIYFKK